MDENLDEVCYLFCCIWEEGLYQVTDNATPSLLLLHRDRHFRKNSRNIPKSNHNTQRSNHSIPRSNHVTQRSNHVTQRSNRSIQMSAKER